MFSQEDWFGMSITEEGKMGKGRTREGEKKLQVVATDGKAH
jgi:hypothetical protein